MWEEYKRPPRELRVGIFPAINIHRQGMQLNRMACQQMDICEGDIRWFLFYTDKERPDRFGFRILLNKQPDKLMNLYKVTYRPISHTAKINNRRFIEQFNLLDRALKIDRTTFPLSKEKIDGGDIWFFELK